MNKPNLASALDALNKKIQVNDSDFFMACEAVSIRHGVDYYALSGAYFKQFLTNEGATKC